MFRVKSAGVVLLAVVGIPTSAVAGDLIPPGPPAPTMTTLAAIDAKLNALSETNSLYRFVGVTTATTQGGAGWKGLNDLCVAQFATTYQSTRMCSTEEVMKTPVRAWPTLAGEPSGYWLQPVLLFSAFSGSNFYVFEYSGAFFTSSGSPGGALSCDRWSTINSSGVGIALSSAGSIATVTCNTSLGVACCSSPDETP